jgi:hypothetical protein
MLCHASGALAAIKQISGNVTFNIKFIIARVYSLTVQKFVDVLEAIYILFESIFHNFVKNFCAFL